MSSIQIEKEILGAVLLSEANFWEVSDFLEPKAFASKDHQAIFGVMTDLANANRGIRATSVASRLGSMESGTEPLVYLSGLLDMATKQAESDPVPLVENAEDLARDYVKRRFAELGKWLVKQSESATADPYEIADGIIGQASDLVHAADQRVERSLTQVGHDVTALLQQALNQGGIGLTSGLVSLDAMIGKIFPGDFILLGGMPGGGKTSLAMQMALHIAKKESVAFIELEMESRMLLLRTVASDTGVSVRKMLDGVTEGQFASATAAVQNLSGRKIHMVAQRGMTITQVEARIRSMKRRHGIKAAFVDHIGLIKRPGKFRMNRADKDFDNAEQLMELGKAIGVSIIGLCHLTKMARQKEGDPEPTMEDFSGGGMEQHADLMLCTFNRWEWLQKNKPKTNGKAMETWAAECMNSLNRMEVFKLKDRKGAMRERKILHWDGERTLLSDVGGQQERMEGF